MIDRSYLSEIINASFPDLKSTGFNFNNLTISSFTESTLLPFLVYQNTIDTNHRLIGLYLPETCNTMNLVPFYVIMGHYRKALNKIMSTNKYENQSFGRNEKLVVFDGDVCTVSSIDFINRQVVLKSGRGRVTHLSFYDSYKIRWNYTSSLDLKTQMDSFDKIDLASRFNIFTFPLSPKDNQYEGVIIFTNTLKFESILRNVKISGNDLREHLNIQKVIFQQNDDIKFELLSKPNTKNKPVSVLVARLDAFRAFSNIIASDYDRLKHIKTIIIDDFDELVLQWQKRDILTLELNNIKENYYNDLKDKILKDVYLVSKNKNLEIHKSLADLNIDYYPWLIKPVEEVFLNTNQKTDILLELKEVCSEGFNLIMTSIKILLEKWKEFARNNYCQGSVIAQINQLLSLKSKISTFCDPNIFRSYINQFENNLMDFKIKWFTSNLDYGLINETISILKTNITHDFINIKVFEIITLIEQNNCQKGKVVIASDNKNEDDKKYINKILISRFPDLNLELHDINLPFMHLMNSGSAVDLIFFLTYRNKTLKTVLTNVLSSKQIFLLDSENIAFAGYTIPKIQNLISELGADEKNYNLLNVPLPLITTTDSDGKVKIAVTKCDNKYFDKPLDTKFEEDSFDFELFVQDVLGKFHADNHTLIGNQGFYKIFFEDGTSKDFPEHRRFFHYDENDQDGELTKYLKDIDKLNWGDQIIIPKNNEQLRVLLDYALNKDPAFENSIKCDEEWRTKILTRLKSYNWDYSEFRRRLSASGFVVESDITIKNWLEKDTQRPHNFEKLLIALVKLGVIDENRVPQYLGHNGKLKTAQVTFVREAIKKLISHLHGINYSTEESLIDEELLNEFIELIEIKKVTSIIKI